MQEESRRSRSRYRAWKESIREDNKVLIELAKGWPGRIYAVGILITFAWQIYLRTQICEPGLCMFLGLFKSAFWAAIWPFYWTNYFTGFVLFHPWRR